MLVTFPYSPVDQELAVKLAAWIKELGENEGHHALIVRDVRCHSNNDASIRHDLLAVFDSVNSIDVVDRIDGWPQAPNIVFRNAAKHIQYVCPQPWLWCEADVVPLKPGWVEAIWREYAACGKPFLADFVKVENVIPHASGICVYPGKLTEYAGNAVMATDIAWDCYAADQIVPQMAQTHLIKHKWKHPKLNNQSEVDNLLAQLGDAVLFHADKSGSLIEFLSERRYPKPQQNPVQVNVDAGIGTTDIFIKTHEPDYPWLSYSLWSISRFTSGFRNCVIVTDKKDGSGIIEKIPYDNKFGSQPKRITWRGWDKLGNDGYLSQQVAKMYADGFSDADFLLYLDSDTIFTRPVTPETYFKDGKPIIMITPIDQAHPDEQNAWRRVMHKFMGKPSDYEFMRRFPILYPRWAYAALREFCIKQHGVELDKYIMSQPYREFSEFNCMGFFLHEFHRDKFTWIDTSKIPESEWPELTVDQQWSHNPIPVEKWEKILQSESMVKNKSVDPDLTRLSTNETDLNSGLQSNLDGEATKTSGTEEPKIPAPPPSNSLSMQDHVKALGDYASENGFARMRVIKQLRSVNLIPKKK